MKTATAEMLTEAPKGKPALVEPASDKRKTLFKAQDEAPAPAIRLIDKMPPPQARPGNLIMNLTNELLNKLKSQCEPLAPGARRDWAKLAEVINECHGKLYGNLERRQIDREGLTSYQQYLILLGHTGSNVFNGVGPSIAGVKTPSSNGTGYAADRDRLCKALEHFDIGRKKRHTIKVGYTGPWIDLKTKKPIRLELVG